MCPYSYYLSKMNEIIINYMLNFNFGIRVDQTTIAKVAKMATMKTWHPEKMIPRAAEDLSAAVMESFMPWSQWFLTPQMYHLFPGVLRGILSFPLVNASFSVGLVQSWNPVPFTLYTLWFGGLYLNTAKWFISTTLAYCKTTFIDLLNHKARIRLS